LGYCGPHRLTSAAQNKKLLVLDWKDRRNTRKCFGTSVTGLRKTRIFYHTCLLQVEHKGDSFLEYKAL
jgi:hypothetical protein